MLDEKQIIDGCCCNDKKAQKALFEYDQDVSLSNGQPVNFYNYSKDADYFAWDFGDNERSTISDPVHYYASPGEYELTIYNRVRQVIFQSSDINFGGDGYYQDQLSGQGVYIWKVRGRYANGKTFVKSGDVTLIWK